MRNIEDHNINPIDKSYIFTSPAIWPMIEYELDIAQRLLDQGKKVFWVRCEGDESFCPANIFKKKRICAECISKSNNAVKWIGENKNFQILKKKISLSTNQKQTLKNICLNFNHPEKMQKNDIIFDDWKNTIVSTLQTLEKKFFLNVDLDKKIHRNVIKNLVETYYFAMKEIVNSANLEVYIFNGRMSGYRPIMRICQKNEIPMYTYEFPNQGFKRYFLCKNNYSHDLIFKSKQFLTFYNDHYFSEDKKIALGKIWLDKRIYGKVKMGIEENFSKSQIVGKIPEYMRAEDRIKILISLSTEWEVGGVIENKRYFFNNQYNSIKKIINYYEKNNKLLFIIKIHPQHKNFDTELEQDYKKFDLYENVKVISSDNFYDTYEIIKNSDIVMTFISLIGPESAYLGKRVICIGPSSYEYFELSNNPKTSSELFDLLNHFKKDQDYDFNQAKINACKWAFARSWSGTKTKYIFKDNLNKLYMIKNNNKMSIKSDLFYHYYNNIFKIYYLFKRLLLKKKINYSNFKKVFKVFKDDIY